MQRATPRSLHYSSFSMSTQDKSLQSAENTTSLVKLALAWKLGKAIFCLLHILGQLYNTLTEHPPAGRAEI